MSKIHDEILKEIIAYCENYQMTLIKRSKRFSRAVFYQRQRNHLRELKALIVARAMEIQLTRPDQSRSHMTPGKVEQVKAKLKAFKLKKFNSED